MKQKIFVLVSLLFLTYTGGCLPGGGGGGDYYFPPWKKGDGFHREGLLLAQTHIPKKVRLVWSNSECYPNNSEATKQLKSRLASLGFNFVGEGKTEAVFDANCAIIFVPSKNFGPLITGRKDYRFKLGLYGQRNDTIWEGHFYGSSIRQATDEVLELLEKDIKLFNAKLEKSGVK